MNTMFRAEHFSFQGISMDPRELPTFYTKDHEHSLRTLNEALNRRVHAKLVGPTMRFQPDIISIRDSEFFIVFRGVM